MKKIDKSILIGIVIGAVLGLSFIFRNKDNGLNTDKLNNDKTIKGQYEVTDIVRGYIGSISNITDYARNNSKIEFSVKELKGIFNIDITSFRNNKYNCNEDTTFIKFDDNYDNYIVVLDCKDFYLD